jgi:glycosyltransferase involved in cell wall biosynthesis
MAEKPMQFAAGPGTSAHGEFPAEFDWEVVVASPCWVLNGVNTFSERLVGGLIERGVRAHVLLTGSSEGNVKPLPLPNDIPIRRLPVDPSSSWHARWEGMLEYLNERAPCIYIPNHDYAYSCIAPALQDDVVVVGVVHSDDPEHYAHARAMGRYWNATVAVSRAVDEELRAMQSGWEARVSLIQHGVPAPMELPRRRVADRPLRIIYVGRLVQRQKRVLDLPKIMAGLTGRGVPATLTVIGGGADHQALESAIDAAGESGNTRFLGILSPGEVTRELLDHDVMLLVSDFEGMPTTVLEAMASGCVPVVTAIRSGIPELVEDGVSGCTVAVGHIEGFVEKLARLAREPQSRERLSAGAFEAIHSGGFTREAMTDRYIDLFRRIAKEQADGSYRRPRGQIVPLPWTRPSWKDRLPNGLRRALSLARQALGT